MSYLVHLRQFEGPLGLLLYLIRKEEMDIFDINVNQITGQYLEYIRQMKELDLEVAGEFVAMAATLIHIKSRMLLPNYNEEGEVVEAEDPRKELVQKLLEYQRYQDAAKRLYERPLLGRDIFARGVRADFRTDEELGEVLIDEDGLFGLISAYRKSVRKAVKYIHQVRPKVQSIAMRVLEIKERLIIGTRVILRDLLGIGEGSPRAQLLVTFLSMLELGRMGYVSIFQNEIYGDIYIDPLRPIERNVLERVQEFDSGDTEAIANSMINEANEEKIDMAEAMELEADQPQQQLALEMMEAGMLVPALDGTAHEGFVAIASDDEILAAEAEIDGVPLAAVSAAASAAASDEVSDEVSGPADEPPSMEVAAVSDVESSEEAVAPEVAEMSAPEAEIGEMSANGEPTADLIAESNFEEPMVVEAALSEEPPAPVLASAEISDEPPSMEVAAISDVQVSEEPSTDAIAVSSALESEPADLPPSMEVAPEPIASPELEMLADAAPELVDDLSMEQILETADEQPPEIRPEPETGFAGASAFEHEPTPTEIRHDADHEPEAEAQSNPSPKESSDPESFV